MFLLSFSMGCFFSQVNQLNSKTFNDLIEFHKIEKNKHSCVNNSIINYFKECNKKNSIVYVFEKKTLVQCSDFSQGLMFENNKHYTSRKKMYQVNKICGGDVGLSFVKGLGENKWIYL